MTALLLALALAVQAAPQTIAEIRVHGNVAVADAEVETIAGVGVGQAFTAGTPDAAAARLRASGRFDVVDVRTRYRDLEMTQVALVLVVHEKPGTSPAGEPPSTMQRLRSRLMFFPILDYDDGYGWTYGARTSMVAGRGSRARLSVPLSWGGTRRAAIEAERTFTSGPLTRISGSYGIEQRENPHFQLDDRRVALSARAERRLFGRLLLGAGAARQRVTFGSARDGIWTTGVDATLDTRNDPAYPSDAVLLRGAWTRLHGVDAPDTTATGIDKYAIEARGYKRVYGSIVFAARGEYDTASGPLPGYEQYLLGGWQLRGTHAGLLAGDRRLLWSTELRVPFTSPLSGARTGFNVFVDGGAVAPHAQSIADARMERGAGGGLFLIATVIRLNLSVAHSLDGRGTRVQFGTGFTF
jgi:outer membrane protein assembly factor BamA